MIGDGCHERRLLRRGRGGRKEKGKNTINCVCMNQSNVIIGYRDTVVEWQKCGNKRFVIIYEHFTVVLDPYLF